MSNCTSRLEHHIDTAGRLVAAASAAAAVGAGVALATNLHSVNPITAIACAVAILGALVVGMKVEG